MFKYILLVLLLTGFVVSNVVAEEPQKITTPAEQFLKQNNRSEKYELHSTSIYAIKLEHTAGVNSFIIAYTNIKEHFSENKKVVRFAEKRIDNIKENSRKIKKMIMDDLKQNLKPGDQLYHYILDKPGENNKQEGGLLILSKDGKLRKKFPEWGVD